MSLGAIRDILFFKANENRLAGYNLICIPTALVAVIAAVAGQSLGTMSMTSSATLATWGFSLIIGGATGYLGIPALTTLIASGIAIATPTFWAFTVTTI